MPPSTTEVDPITLEMVQEGLIATVREMRANMIRTAYSSIIYEGHDFSCCVVDAQGQLAAKAPADNPMHILPVPWSVRAVLDRFDDDLHPGDVFLHNDPYTGGTHLNDVATIYPVFLEDGLVAFAVVRAHWADIGGMTPGSLSGQATEIYQEGVRIPPIRVYERAQPVQAALDLIFANVRGERQRKGDFTATLVSCWNGARKLETMAGKYGAATVRTCLARIIARAEARVRQALAALPDGTYAYEAYTESTGQALEPLLARLKLAIQDDELTADFSGSSPQSPGPTNTGPAMVPAAVFAIAKSHLDPATAVNQGAWRPMHVRVPEGTFLNALLPAACGGMAEARYAAESALLGALASVAPEAAIADHKGTVNHIFVAGRYAGGEPFIFYEWPAAGTGAFNGADGSNTVRNYQEGDFASIQPVEAVENEYPLLVERCEVRRDSGGAGRWRGGIGMQREERVLAGQAVLSVLSDRTILLPHGVCGGEAGAGNRFTVRRDGREIEPSPIPGKVSGFPLRRDDVVVMRSAGAGGYGDPLDRPPEQVWRDVVEGYLSAEAARTRYGVALVAEGVDEAATEALRAALRTQRVFATLTIWPNSEPPGVRRTMPLARAVAEQAGVAEGDVVELVNPQGAPLRGWAHILDEEGDRAYLGPFGLHILRAQPGDRFWLRRLGAWAAPQ
ncbi:MAG: hydantoinase B/oxoprolinase family protein [Chloroflexi bacterium]|nr:hydantoinase B/oxoprolinase family protein [Chloroflexota bacterium]